MFNEGETVYFGKFAVEILEVDDYNDRYLVNVKKGDVDWEGYVGDHFLTAEKEDRDYYPWQE